jgi:hypothetical protein
MHRRRSHLSGPGILCNPQCPAITTAQEGCHQQQPTSPSGRNQQLSDSSQVRSTAATPPPSCAPFLCPTMPVCGRLGRRWSGDTKAQLLIHLRSKVHENERIGHLTLASIGAQYCDNCGQLRSVLGQNHRCERHLGSQPQPSSPASTTSAALPAPASQTANTALANRTPATPEPPLDPTTSADRAPGWPPALPAQALCTTQASRANQAASTTPAAQAALTSGTPAATSVVLTPFAASPCIQPPPPPHTHRPDPPLRHQQQPQRPTPGQAHAHLQLPLAPSIAIFHAPRQPDRAVCGTRTVGS